MYVEPVYDNPGFMEQIGNTFQQFMRPRAYNFPNANRVYNFRMVPYDDDS